MGVRLPILSRTAGDTLLGQDFHNSASPFGLKVMNSRHNGHTHIQNRNSNTPTAEQRRGEIAGKPTVWDIQGLPINSSKLAWSSPPLQAPALRGWTLGSKGRPSPLAPDS